MQVEKVDRTHAIALMGSTIPAVSRSDKADLRKEQMRHHSLDGLVSSTLLVYSFSEALPSSQKLVVSRDCTSIDELMVTFEHSHRVDAVILIL